MGQAQAVLRGALAYLTESAEVRGQGCGLCGAEDSLSGAAGSVLPPDTCGAQTPGAASLRTRGCFLHGLKSQPLSAESNVRLGCLFPTGICLFGGEPLDPNPWGRPHLASGLRQKQEVFNLPFACTFNLESCRDLQNSLAARGAAGTHPGYRGWEISCYSSVPMMRGGLGQTRGPL